MQITLHKSVYAFPTKETFIYNQEGWNAPQIEFSFKYNSFKNRKFGKSSFEDETTVVHDDSLQWIGKFTERTPEIWICGFPEISKY